MSISLPCSRGLFIHMQEALCHVKGKRVMLTRGVHQALLEFCWIVEDLGRQPTIMYELIPLQPMLDGHHESTGYMSGGEVLPGTTVVPWNPQHHPSPATTYLEPAGAHPIV